MRKYVLYSCTKEGHVERMSYAIYKCYNCSDNSSNPFSCPDNFINRYTHEETLVGWPEAKVFWEKESGLSLGLAALTSFPPD